MDKMKNVTINPVYRKRLWVNRIGMFYSVAGMLLGLGVLLWILVTLLINGFSALSLNLFMYDTPAPGSVGGLRNAIVGTLLMVGTATLMSIPVGILAGTYLAEYGERNKLAQFLHFITDIMLSAPSIVIGIFVYVICIGQGGHFSGYAGSFALALIAVPVVMRTTDNMLRLVPSSLLEAAHALGAPRWKVALMVRARAAKAGIVTGILLAVARISGETAPLLFTALGNQFLSMDMNRELSSVPQVMAQFGMSPYDDWRSLAWGGALVLTLAVLGLNILSRTVFSQKAFDR
jgi:phosphate transport system permease protein